jgi:hypothetical protein
MLDILRLLRLRAAVAGVSAAMDGYAAAGPQDREALAARQAQRQLEEALRVVQPPPVSGP